VALHAEYGGVVPELASRDHVRKLLPLVRQTLDEAGLSLAELDGVAYTRARVWSGPCWSGPRPGGRWPGRWTCRRWRAPHGRPPAGPAEEVDPAHGPLQPPFVALLVSGGHTQLVAVEAIGRYRLLGETLDDAAGEAFDKTAKLMGLPYPGGPHLARLAEQGEPGTGFPAP
jgi:N6-L-threonylcarbamoyladenine synthase